MSEPVDRDELDITAEEWALAQELSAALERNGTADRGEELEQLVETAQLVRLSRHFEWSAERHTALRAEMVAAFDQRQRRDAPESRTRWWALWLPLPVAAAAALLWVGHGHRAALEVASMAEDRATKERAAALDSAEVPESLVLLEEEALPEDEAEPPHSAAALEPSLRLLETQATALAASASDPKGRQARAALDRELGEHRARLMANLEAKLR